MTPEQFIYWLQGYFELQNSNATTLNADQCQIIQDHLDLVFQKVTPSRKEKETSLDKFLELESEKPSWFQSIPYKLNNTTAVVISLEPRFVPGRQYKVFYNNEIINDINSNFKSVLDKNTPIVLDDSLTCEKGSVCSGTETHIAGLSVSGIGMTNVGSGPIAYC